MKVLVLVLDHEVLVLVSVFLQFLKTFVVILDGSEQGTPWHFVRDNTSSLLFGSHCLREPSVLHAHRHEMLIELSKISAFEGRTPAVVH